MDDSIATVCSEVMANVVEKVAVSDEHDKVAHLLEKHADTLLPLSAEDMELYEVVNY